jgi:hypothetical protein
MPSTKSEKFEGTTEPHWTTQPTAVSVAFGRCLSVTLEKKIVSFRSLELVCIIFIQWFPQLGSTIPWALHGGCVLPRLCFLKSFWKLPHRSPYQKCPEAPAQPGVPSNSNKVVSHTLCVMSYEFLLAFHNAYSEMMLGLLETDTRWNSQVCMTPPSWHGTQSFFWRSIWRFL